MTSTEIILYLLRTALREPQGELGSGTGMGIATVDWQEVMDVASEQEVLEVCFDAVELLPEDQRPDIDTLVEWFGQTAYQESDYAHQWEVACELDRMWASKGISAAILKGRSVAQYYPKPNHRYSCDLDVFIKDGWEDACNLMADKGVDMVYEVYKEAEFTYKDVYVECHRYITPVRGNKNLLGFERYLRSLLAAEHKTFEGTTLVNPPVMFTALLCIEHALGDFLHGPLKLKHVADWMVLRKQEIHWVTFLDRCNEFGFGRFYWLLDTFADVVEGKAKYGEMPKSYKRAFDEMLKRRKGSAREKSWTERRVNQFFDVLGCGWKFREFGYWSMKSYLAHTLWVHWFDKEVKI